MGSDPIDEKTIEFLRQYRISGPLLIAIFVYGICHFGFDLTPRTSLIVSGFIFICDVLTCEWILRKYDDQQD